MEAGADLQHVISSDRPCSSFYFLAHGSERVRILWDIRPLTSARSVPLCPPSLSASLSFFSALSHGLPLTSPALSLQLGRVFVVSHPVVFHWHWDGPEPAWSTGNVNITKLPTHTHTHTQTHTHKHHQTAADILNTSQKHADDKFTGLWALASHDWVLGWRRPRQGLTIGGSAPPADWWHLWVLVVLVTVQYSILLHQRKPSATLLVQVGVWWIRSFCDVVVQLRIVTCQIALVVSAMTGSGKVMLMSLKTWTNEWGKNEQWQFQNTVGNKQLL